MATEEHVNKNFAKDIQYAGSRRGEDNVQDYDTLIADINNLYTRIQEVKAILSRAVH